MSELYRTITEEEVKQWCEMPMTDATLSRLTEILNGEYTLDQARMDILSFRLEKQWDMGFELG